MIAECLAAAGVEQVVWIDDNFARRNREQNFEALLNAFKVARTAQPAATIEIPHLGTYPLVDPLDDALDALENAQATCTDLQVAEAAGMVEQFAGVVPPDANLDLTGPEIAALLAGFGDKITTQSLGDWTKGGAEKFAGADRKTLFLIDKEFYREDAGFDGLVILKNLAASDAFCMMFTCRCEEGKQEECRKTYSEKEGIEAHRFSVISKLNANAARPIVERFAYALRAAFLHRHTGDLAWSLAKELHKTIDQVARDLIAQNVTDLDQAIFENSISEGASELDVLLRINVLRQRRDARHAFQGVKLRDILVEMRRFRQAMESTLPNPEPAALEQFRIWRQIEVCEDGDLINAIHSPLSCGDIFACTSGTGADVKTKEFLLLAQPCDLMVREKGTRIAEAGLMVQLTKETPNKETRSAARFHEIVGVLPNNQVWRLDFLNSFVADLTVLDLCVFDSKGKVSIATNTTVAAGLLTAGYEVALNDAKKWLTKVFTPGSNIGTKPLSVGTRGNRYQPKLNQTTSRLDFPLTRVGRLEPALAHAALAAWASYQTRAALDHDFARVAEMPPSPDTTAPLPTTTATETVQTTPGQPL